MESVDLAPFPCTGCGKCCRLVGNSPETAWLDRGDGTCRHFDESNLRCTIYETRPLACRVEDYYRQHMADRVAWPEFVRINLEICAKL